MEYTCLSHVLANEPAYRLKQVTRAVYVDLCEDWELVSVLPKGLRETLARACPLTIHAEEFVSKDGDTVKALVTLKDAARIETVLMRHEGRNTVCVSTLVGCPMGCTFCATGKMGMVRKLTSSEIVEQVLYFARYFRPKGERVGSVVFMGMGEPFLNYDAVLEAIRILNGKDGFNIGARHISISTCGIPEGILRLAGEDTQVNLAVSLHAPNDAIRGVLMPVARAYPLPLLMSAIDTYIAKTNRKVMFEYLLVDGVNDAETHARELVALLKGKLCMVNLISYNPTGVYTATSEAGINRFKRVLERGGVECTIRYRFGRDIEGACGQLATASGN